MQVLLHVDEYNHWLRGGLEDVIAYQDRCFPDELTSIEKTSDPWFRRKPAIADASGEG